MSTSTISELQASQIQGLTDVQLGQRTTTQVGAMGGTQSDAVTQRLTDAGSV
jgi:hypothetical protein